MLKFAMLAGTIGFSVYGQIIIKNRAAALSAGSDAYLWRMLTDPLVLSGFLSGGLAALCWLVAIRQLPLTIAYPFLALSFVFVPVAASLFLGEALGPTRLLAMVLIAGGVVLNAFAG